MIRAVVTLYTKWTLYLPASSIKIVKFENTRIKARILLQCQSNTEWKAQSNYLLNWTEMTWNLNISVALYDNFIFFWVNAIGFLDSELTWIWWIWTLTISISSPRLIAVTAIVPFKKIISGMCKGQGILQLIMESIKMCITSRLWYYNTFILTQILLIKNELGIYLTWVFIVCVTLLSMVLIARKTTWSKKEPIL